ncbi:MAG: DUF2062 domain-containing protein, partial [Deltaproteobacteria bacterium]|nr:DUF2062 domain-containing protein [Deltaproteobacteria bacterium]
SATPTIPFHTALALFLSFIFKASKPAAALGVWVCNPLTLPLFYYSSYKFGTYLFGISEPLVPGYGSILELLKLGTGLTLAMVSGGVLIGIPTGVFVYIITLNIFKKIRAYKK